MELFNLESCRTPFYTVHSSDVSHKICVLAVPVLQTFDGGTALGKAAFALTEVLAPAEARHLQGSTLPAIPSFPFRIDAAPI